MPRKKKQTITSPPMPIPFYEFTLPIVDNTNIVIYKENLCTQPYWQNHSQAKVDREEDHPPRQETYPQARRT